MGTKCPHCGSRNTANILYGMPAFSEKFQKDLDNGKIVLGGCCITGFDPKKHCNDCGKDFASPAVFFAIEKDEPIPYEDTVTQVDFTYGGFFYGRKTISFKKTEAGADVIIGGIQFDREDPELPPEDAQITADEWYSLLDKLYNKMYLHEWVNEYKPDGMIMDGIQWNLTVTLSSKEEIEYYGENEYPPYWTSLLRLLGKYGFKL